MLRGSESLTVRRREQASLLQVVVVTYNSAEVVEGLLHSLETLRVAGVGRRLIVVDNASTDDTIRTVRTWASDAEVIRLRVNEGYAAAINAGLTRLDSARPVLVLNPDARLVADGTEPLLRAIAEPGVGVAIPRLTDGCGRLQLSLRREPSLTSQFGMAFLPAAIRHCVPWLEERVSQLSTYCERGHHDWATGAALLIAPRALDLVGHWSEDYFLYSEETDYCNRVRSAGLNILFVPEATVEHLGGESGTNPSLWSLLMLNRYRYYRSRHRAGISYLYWLTLIGQCLLRLHRERYRAALFNLLAPGSRDRLISRLRAQAS